MLSYPFLCKVRDHQWRNEASRSAGRVDDTVQCGRIVGRQIVGVLQIGHRRRSVKSKRQRYKGNAHIRPIADIRHGHQEQTRNYMSWINVNGRYKYL